MKKNYIFLITLITFTVSVNAQAVIAVLPPATSASIGAADLAKTNTLPFYLKFDNTFAGHTINFYADNTGATSIANVVFKKSEDFGPYDGTNYRILIRDNNLVDLKGSTVPFTNKLYFKIDGGNLIGPINIASSTVPPGASSSGKTYTPGYYFYDALYISNNWKGGATDSKKLDTIKLILKNYKIESNKDIAGNTFLNNALSGLYNEGSLQADITLQSYSNLVSQAGGLNVTNFADGLAQFLVERFKEELSTAFFSKFKDDINKPEYKDLQILFPETYKVLNTIDKNIYQYSAYLNTLRQSFIKDITNLYVNFQQVIKQDKYNAYFNAHPDIKTIVTNSFFFINQYSNGIHPGKVLANYNPDQQLFFKNVDLQTNVRSSVKIMQLISVSLMSHSKLNYWIPVDSIELLVKNDETFKIYMGLIYQQEPSITFSDGTKLKPILNKVAGIDDDVHQYENFIETIGSNIQEINEYMAKLKTEKKSEIDYNDYYNLFNSSLNLLQNSFSFINLPGMDNLPLALKQDITNTSNWLLFVTRSSGELYVDIRTKNYSSAILNLVTIVDTVLNTKAAVNSLNSDLLTKTVALSGLENLAANKLTGGTISKIKKCISDYSKNNQDLTGMDNTIKSLIDDTNPNKQNIGTSTLR